MSEPSIFPHQPGDVVSTAQRYSARADYRAAVDKQKLEPHLAYNFDNKGSACSFKMPDYTEILLMWQPDNQGYPTDCQIKYVYLDKTVSGLWIKYNLLIAKGQYEGLESINRSLRGVNDDANEVRRVVFRNVYKPLNAELDGYIINPPYPPFAPPATSVTGSIPMAVGALIGIGVLVWLLARRRRFG